MRAYENGRKTDWARAIDFFALFPFAPRKDNVSEIIYNDSNNNKDSFIMEYLKANGMKDAVRNIIP